MMTSAASYEIPYATPGADAVLYSAPTAAPSAASYEIPYATPGADAVLYSAPTAARELAEAPAAQRRTLQRPPGGGDGIRRNNTNRKPSRYDGFGTKPGAPIKACAYIAGDGMKCVGPPMDGGLHCKNHTCGLPGCRTPKSSRVAACPEHLTSNA